MDEAELRHMLYSATRYGGPVTIRYPRGTCTGVDIGGPLKEISPGSATVLKEGTDVTIIALGTMVTPALEAAKRLETSGIKAGVINARFVKPLAEELILKAAAVAGAIVTVEENALQGGFGSAVLELFEEHGVSVSVRRIGVPDEFVEHGTQDELRSRIGLDGNGIEKAVKALLGAGAKKSKAVC
jgi:1-deoxy-D-xylulose-5-phosphate synthase